MHFISDDYDFISFYCDHFLWFRQYISQLQCLFVFAILKLPHNKHFSLLIKLTSFSFISTVSHNSDLFSCYWLYITIATSFCSCNYHTIGNLFLVNATVHKTVHKFDYLSQLRQNFVIVTISIATVYLTIMTSFPIIATISHNCNRFYFSQLWLSPCNFYFNFKRSHNYLLLFFTLRQKQAYIVIYRSKS